MMKIKKNLVFGVLSLSIISIMMITINGTMIQARNYDKLIVQENDVELGSMNEKEPRTKMIIMGVEYGVNYTNSVDLQEGITVEKAIELAIQKVTQEYGQEIDSEIGVWDYQFYGRISTLESKDSWGIELHPIGEGKYRMSLLIEVDKKTGTCNGEGISVVDDKNPMHLGKYEVLIEEPMDFPDIEEGITVEKAIAIAEEKTQEMYGYEFSINNRVGVYKDIYSSKEKSENWYIVMSPENELENGSIFVEVNKNTGEVISHSYISDEMYESQMNFLNENSSTFDPMDIEKSRDPAVAKSEALAYAQDQQDSDYHQSAIDFMNKHSLNEEHSIKNIQGVLSTSLSEIERIKNGFCYLVEVELDSGEFLLVSVDKVSGRAFAYEKASDSYEKRLDTWLSTYYFDTIK